MTVREDWTDDVLRQVLRELVAIRQLLEQGGVCPHGSTGVCMYCLMQTMESTLAHEMRQR